MRICLLLLALSLFGQDLSGQINGYFGEITGSYVEHTETGLKRELAIRNSVGLLLGRRWAVGLKFQHIFYDNFDTGSEYMHIWGPFGRWGIRRKRLYFYVELGFNWGNYSTLGNFVTGDVLKEDGLIYLSYGWAMEWKAKQGISLKFGLIGQELLNRPRPQYGLNAYVVGLVFDLQKRK